MLMTVSSCSSDDREFKALDDALDRIDAITTQKENELASVRQMLNSAADDNERYALNNKLYDEYMSFVYDSAAYYVERNMELSQKMGDGHRVALSKMKKVNVMSVNGLFPEATELLNSVDTTVLTKQEMLEYYDLHGNLDLHKAEYYDDTPYRVAYIQSTIAYRKKIIASADKNSFIYNVALATNLAEEVKTREAIEVLEGYLKRSQLKSGSRYYSIVTNILAYFYDREGDPEKQREYLILSAVSDTEGGIRENNSLCSLANLLFTTHEYARAYKYLKASLADANFYGTRLRNMQAASLTPKIIEAYTNEQNAVKTRNMLFMMALMALSALLIVAVVVTIVLLNRYRKANERANVSNEKLNEAIVNLKATNEQLEETGRVKNEYLGRFLDLNATVLNRVDENMKHSFRLLRDKKYEDLILKLKNATFVYDMSKEFNNNFDEAFLNIYPTFIEDVNALLLPGEQFELKEKRRLSTEFRIIALIRLGISDNQRICTILRTSLATVYTYRSKFKTRAIDKEHFEENICKIQAGK